ncbi:hypothetical protein [Halopiger aswanensis]|uniref:Uncharacterized protein n=1 Tax=Halopiger aswanensis TaxID=148449 RepID=A0A3R7DAJ2_9EURY|nr:hypothetical protein [Halopiger aswanensis]RKD95591.1 hypothetical protein ATJ93_2449 [Halopiger aswanensis]
MSEQDTPTDADTGGLSDTAAFWIAAVVSAAVAVGSIWLVQGPSYQTLLRIRPTVGGGGVGTAWVAGNTEPLLNALVSLLHIADVLMGAFIIVMVAIHWAAFRRLSDRMQPPAGAEPEARSGADADVATDGGVESSATDETARANGGDAA